jgi:N-acetylmuramoyl-L-alanine amidase
MKNPTTKVKDVLHTCSTASVHGLSLQIIGQLNLIVPNAMVSFTDLDVEVRGAQINPFLQPKAKESLAIAIQKRGKKLVVNSAYRTVAQQFLLRRQYELGRCGIPAAAPPSLSNHEKGLALDIEDPDGWEPYFEQHGFLRLGSFDPPHYNYNILAGIRQDLNSLGVKAFQGLWNKHNPNRKISEDGVFGSNTAEALGNSPVDGFV